MAISNILTSQIEKAIDALFGVTVEKIEMQATRKEFEGDVTMVIFPLLKVIKGSNPAELGGKIGEYLVENAVEVEKFNVVGGFLNLVIADAYYINYFNAIKNDENFAFPAHDPKGKAVMVEYASPNTNKPLHLGHVRNVLLGYSVANIIEASGKKVYKTQVINDRGIHICKSMVAWKNFAPLGSDGEKETPETSFNLEFRKGDKLVGNYYVEFDRAYKDELKKIYAAANAKFEEHLKNAYETHSWPKFDSEIIDAFDRALRTFVHEVCNIDSESVKSLFFTSDFALSDIELVNGRLLFLNSVKDFDFVDGTIEESFTLERKKALTAVKKELDKIVPIMLEAQEMLRKWEAGDSETMNIWSTMNGWVYKGFEETYKNIGVTFDQNYYESNTYLLGKDVVADGLAKGVFEKDPDGSVWIDLTSDGLDRKIVLRSDGTSVYITQDIGTAIQRVKDFPDVGGMVYTVGNEQDYHFKVLFLILKKLGYDWAQNLYHLSYGMVDLPSGKMKSREGTVVDADDLMAEMTATAKSISEELGKLEGYSDEEKGKLYETIGLGALKYQMLRVDPKKRILFDPNESIDFNGDSGPFIQMSYVRTRAILRKADFDLAKDITEVALHDKEKDLIKQVELFAAVVQNAAHSYSPALIANYAYDLAKEFSSYYQVVSILGEEDLDTKVFRVQLSKKVGETIKAAFGLLGINMPERM